MTIKAIANHNQLDEVQVEISATMKLREWKIIQQALKSSITSSYNHTTAVYLHSLSDIIENYSEKLENTIEKE